MSMQYYLRGFVFAIFTVALLAKTWDKNFWYENNERELKAALRKPNINVAKNLILAVGDGMGVTTTTAIRIYRGQLTDGMLGEEALLSWDTFPHIGMSKTYSTDVMTPDSACTATAYHCGVKTKYDTVGVDDTIVPGNCSTVAGASVDSLLQMALIEGKSVGLVTTDSLSGGSVAPAYAHSASRDWTTDAELPENARGMCKDIARQLVEDNLDIQVLLGGGRENFLPNNRTDPEYSDQSGARTDGRDLAMEWLAAQLGKKRKAKYVTNKAEFDEATAENTGYLLGMFEPGRLQEETTRQVNKTEPSLTEMTEKAVQILSKNQNGFYLFVEGAAIDKGHHQNRAKKALEEGLALDDAVGKVMKMTSSEDTLVVVTADHSHAFAFGGYSTRGQSILSIANNTVKDSIRDKSGNHFTLLTYGSGPGYTNESDRANYTDDYFKQDRLYPAVAPMKSNTHGAEDVQIFASGPMSHIFTGIHEQTFIAHGMAYAACIGSNKEHCADVTVSAAIATFPFTSLVILNLVLTTLVGWLQ